MCYAAAAEPLTVDTGAPRRPASIADCRSRPAVVAPDFIDDEWRGFCCAGCEAVARDDRRAGPRRLLPLPRSADRAARRGGRAIRRLRRPGLPGVVRPRRTGGNPRGGADPRGDPLLGLRLAERADAQEAPRRRRGQRQLRDPARARPLDAGRDRAERHPRRGRPDRLSGLPVRPAAARRHPPVRATACALAALRRRLRDDAGDDVRGAGVHRGRGHDVGGRRTAPALGEPASRRCRSSATRRSRSSPGPGATCAPAASAWTSRWPSASRSRSARASGRRCAAPARCTTTRSRCSCSCFSGAGTSSSRRGTAPPGRSPTSRGSRPRSPSGCPASRGRWRPIGLLRRRCARATCCSSSRARRSPRTAGRARARCRGRGDPYRRERSPGRRSRAAWSSAVRSISPSRWSSASSGSATDTVLAGIVRLAERAVAERQPLVGARRPLRALVRARSARRRGGNRDRVAPARSVAGAVGERSRSWS